MIWWILGFTLLGSVLSLLIAGGFLFLSEARRKALTPSLVAFATGTLLAGALLGLIPEALHHMHEHGGSEENVFLIVLLGIIGFFLLEKLLFVHHCHQDDCVSHQKTPAQMIIVGDALHNFIDGVVIAASFLISIPVGIAATISIAAHEIPQELGDFGIFLHSGYSRKKAFLYNLLSGLTALLGALVGYFALETAEGILAPVMALAAASFLYIALADLGPTLHRQTRLKTVLQSIALMILGVVVIALTLQSHGH